MTAQHDLPVADKAESTIPEQSSGAGLDVKEILEETIANLAKDLRETNATIWNNPELCFEEHIAHDTLTAVLDKAGYHVKRHAYGIETSFEASYGSGGRVIAFNAEYDALPGIGHACGHNLIATSALTAFLGLTAILKAKNIPGRVRLLGTPAEEGGAGKVKLLNAGAYNDVDFCLMGHPGPISFQGEGYTGTAGHRTISRAAVVAQYKGKPAHAGGNPWDGINALDALVSAYNNVAMLRQQITPEQRIHCAILSAPKVSNVIPESTSVSFSVRSPTWAGSESLMGRVRNCIEAGGLAAGCKVEIEEELPYLDTRINRTLCERYASHMGLFGENIRVEAPDFMSASTDMGNITYKLPGLHQFFGIPCPPDVSGHHPSFTAASGTEEAHASAVRSGKGMALLGWDLLSDDTIATSAVEDFKKDQASLSKSR